MTELIKWIEENFREKITLETLSKRAGINEKYLCRIFKEMTGRTPIDYLNDIRIEAACREMLIYRRSVTDAALESGFNDLCYFSRLFKKYKGISPSSYRKTNLI